MGFDVTAANVIFFIAALGIASTAMGAYWQSAEHVEEARRIGDRRAELRAHTNITVVAASYDASDKRFTAEVKNTGSEVIGISELRYLVDGAYVATSAIESVAVLGGPGATDLWLPLETIEVKFAPIEPSPTYFQVVAQNGVKANWRG
ncbi:MAG TPA: hypothetical protein VFH78_10345 [Candidatus Thermoplasmatota archaeon]|nr:hypothetical protein [Candidatus Thermoplasmatota archaeon]